MISLCIAAVHFAVAEQAVRSTDFSRAQCCLQDMARMPLQVCNVPSESPIVHPWLQLADQLLLEQGCN